MSNDSEGELVTAAYTIPADWKARIEREAKLQDRNASQIVRAILREYFERVDATNNSSSSAAIAA